MPRKPGTDKDLSYSNVAYGRAMIHSTPFRISTSFEPRGDQAEAIEQLAAGLQDGGEAPGPARCHGFGQDLHDGQGDRGGAAPGAGPGAQQDAGRAALPRVQDVLSRKRGRVLRLLLRLLPAGSLHRRHRHLHRKGRADQRRNRPAASLRDPVAVRAPRLHHRRQRVVHLRSGFAGSLLRHAAVPGKGQTDPARRNPAPAGGNAVFDRQDFDLERGFFRARGDVIEVFPTYEDYAVRIEMFGDEIDAIAQIDPITGRRF